MEGTEVEDCGVCAEHIEEGQDTICCEGICAKKFHISCVGINTDAAILVDSSINVSFVCNNCSVLTPKGLYTSIKELTTLFKKQDEQFRKCNEEMLLKQDSLNSSIKLYMKDTAKDVTTNQQYLGKLTTAMKTLFESCNEDKGALGKIISYLNKSGTEIEAISKRIGTIEEQTSCYCFEQHLKEINSTMECMTEVTTNMIQIGLDKQLDIVSEINEKFKAKKKKIKLYKKVINGLTYVHLNKGRDKEGKNASEKENHNRKMLKKRRLEGGELVSGAEQQDRLLIKKIKTTEQISSVIELNSSLEELNVDKNQIDAQEQDLFSKIQKIEDNIVSQFISERQRIVKLNRDVGEVNMNSLQDVETIQIQQKNNRKKKELRNSRNKSNQQNNVAPKIQILENVPVSKFDAALNILIFKYNKGVLISNEFLEQQTKSVKHKVKIIGMTVKHERESLERTIKAQNQVLENADITILNIEQSRKGNGEYCATMEIDNESFQKVILLRRINVGWERCLIFKSIDLVRCFKCCGYNHLSFRCFHSQKCSKCAGDHRFKDCTVNEVRCVNCKNANERLRLGLDINHSAWSKSCGVYQQKENLYTSRNQGVQLNDRGVK